MLGRNPSGAEVREVVEEGPQLETPVLRREWLLALQGFGHHLEEEEKLEAAEAVEVEISKEHYLLVASELP